MIKKFLILVVTILFVSSVYATSYSYNQKIPIKDNNNEIGYVQPYKESSILGTWAYLKWQRYGYPVGNTFPIALFEGTTVPLIFGVNGEFVNVKVNKISSNSLDLTIDSTDIQTEVNKVINQIEQDINDASNQANQDIQDASNQIQRNIQDTTNQITNQINQNTQQVTNNVNQFQESFNEVSQELELFNNEAIRRAEKFINRGYYSSLHIINGDSISRQASQIISDAEARLAERVSDRVIPLVIDSFATGVPITGITWRAIVSQIPSEVRHELTRFVLNIGSRLSSNVESDSSLVDDSSISIYVRDNRLIDELKGLGLPYYENGKIVGKRTYDEKGIGLIVSIPEEKILRENTVKQRIENDRVRLYKTLVTGIGDSGVMEAANWYSEQLDLAGDLLVSLINVGDDNSDLLNEIGNYARNNPKSAISNTAILQAWVVTAINSFEPDFEEIKSLGYAVVVKDGNVLEIHTLNGYDVNSYLNPYAEIVEGVEDVKEVVDKIEEVQDVVETTGDVVREVEDTGNIKESSSAGVVGFIKRVFSILKFWGR